MSGVMDDTNNDTNTSDTSEWVHERLAELVQAPGWQPNPQLGLLHLRWHERMATGGRRLQRAGVLTVLTPSVLPPAVPATRGVARQLLDRFYMRRPEAVRATMPRFEPTLF